MRCENSHSRDCPSSIGIQRLWMPPPSSIPRLSWIYIASPTCCQFRAPKTRATISLPTTSMSSLPPGPIHTSDRKPPFGEFHAVPADAAAQVADALRGFNLQQPQNPLDLHGGEGLALLIEEGSFEGLPELILLVPWFLCLSHDSTAITIGPTKKPSRVHCSGRLGIDPICRLSQGSFFLPAIIPIRPTPIRMARTLSCPFVAICMSVIP